MKLNAAILRLNGVGGSSEVLLTTAMTVSRGHDEAIDGRQEFSLISLSHSMMNESDESRFPCLGS